MVIEGHAGRQFQPLRRALAGNLAVADELGEAVAVAVRGEVLADLWGGYRDRARQIPWTEDTLVCVFSVGKPIAALPLLRLIDRGAVGLDDPVAEYWPEYAVNGKEETTIDDVVSHLAGVPGVPDAPRGSAYSWDAMIAAIEAQPPLWPPGETGCYHTFTYGHLVGELVRRVGGRSIGRVVREELAEPLGVEIAFGLGDADQSRCAEIAMTPGDPLLGAIMSPETLIGRCWSPLPLGPGEEDFNSARFRAAQMPAFNAHATARGLARLYSLLASPGYARLGVVSDTMFETMTAERWHAVDPLGLNNRMARGFRLSNAYSPFNHNPRSFGHSGIGGALAFGDPDRGLGFAFVTNRLAPGPGSSPFAERLIAALDACLS